MTMYAETGGNKKNGTGDIGHYEMNKWQARREKPKMSWSNDIKRIDCFLLGKNQRLLAFIDP